MIVVADALFWFALGGLLVYLLRRRGRGLAWAEIGDLFWFWRCRSQIEWKNFEGDEWRLPFRCRCVRSRWHYHQHECRHGGRWGAWTSEHPARLKT